MKNTITINIEMVIPYSETNNVQYHMMMPFFNRNWARACGGHWVGPGSMAGWSAGSWIVGAEVGLLQWSAGSGRGPPVQKEQERRRVSRGFARSRSDA